MKFSHLLTSLVLVTSGHAITSQQVADSINTITELSSETNDIAKNISISNIFSTGPILLNNFKIIVEIAIKDIAVLGGKERRAIEARQESIGTQDRVKRDYLDEFVEALQSMLELLGGNGKRQVPPPFDNSGQQLICEAFRDFVRVHQILLNVVIGKHGLLSLTPFTRPIAVVLRTLEGVVDTLAFAIIDLVPICAPGAISDKETLDRTLTEAINTYE
ncbi:hypothetical protein NOR_08126 [Metarhizium rileyi]|uniref:Cell wall galactomannoprotein n=1 Tax=Metarhizium rileyi (strain RCEF 4871) TaxID=1649241 RepID=A0A166WRX7_METRR|nr:hypothetical protein NOR_08126 [Metarhizium rileyi RCEF 4871]